MSLFREANYHLALEQEEKERLRIEAARRRRVERMDRLLDPRGRTMGIDLDFVQQQERAKAAKAASEAEEARREAAEQARATALVIAMERKGEEEHRKMLGGTLGAIAHRMQHPEESDVWDLNDPKRVLKTAPARVGDDDPRLGLASAQVFAGEDVMRAERVKLQQAQMRAWVAQVHGERVAAKEAEKKENLEFTNRLLTAAHLADEIEGAVGDIGKARQKAAAEFNLRMIEENAARRRAEKEADAEAERIAMATLTTTGAGMGLLAEDLADGVSYLHPNRIRKDYYRGRPEHNPAEIGRAYDEQRAARLREKAAEKELEDKIAEDYRQGVREALRAERQAAADKARKAAEERAALDRQIAEQREAKLRERKEYRAPGFGKEFFEGFGRP